MTTKKKKVKHSTLNVYRNEAIRHGFIYTQFYYFGHDFRIMREYFRNSLQRTLWTIIHRHINDNMKAARNNNAKPALFTPSSFDIYFGEDVRELKEESIEANEVIMERTAYANGSGSLSIGLDPRHMRIYQIFPELDRLRNVVNWAVNEHYRNRGEKCDYVFNNVSSKLYFDNKKTTPHTDIAFTHDHSQPNRHNSQMPDTPVAIVTIGAKKLLEFILYAGSGKGEPVSNERALQFLQKSGCSFIIMDSRDEYFDEDLTYWKHSSRLLDGDACLSLMFRDAQNSVRVYKSSGHLYQPAMIGGYGSKKQKQFDTGWRKYSESSAAYTEMKDEKLQRIRDSLGKYVSTKNRKISI